MKNASCLRLVMLESRKHAGVPLYEWILRQAQQQGLAGATVYRAMAGFGRHGQMHEDRFFELAGELPLQVEIWADESSVLTLLNSLRQQGVDVPFFLQTGSYGSTGGAL